MSELSKHFEPKLVEDKWYAYWKQQGYFKASPDATKKPYTVVIPPPNVTGVLHMGHTLNETVQDIVIRRARMTGYNACWVPGSDHASIATENKVVDMLKKEKGIDKKDLTRETFLQHAFEWKEKYGNIIYHQIEKLGCSVDWDRTTFTMDDHYYQAVVKVFVQLYNKGLIYRGARMINWDPVAKTALSDEEVYYKDIEGDFYYVRYALEQADGSMGDIKNGVSGKDYLLIATKRPETIMGDTGICVHPKDIRYTHLHGKHAYVPMLNKKIPIVTDEYIDMEFGTGVLKVTPAHDINDYNIGIKHNLAVIDTLNEDGTLSEAAILFVGMDRFAARKAAAEKLQADDHLEKIEKQPSKIALSERNGAVVEPRISTQWFVKMDDMAGKALKAVVDGTIQIHPGDRFLNTYKYWLENIKDWCISRQLWWGQRIPAWYDTNGNVVVAETEAEALTQYQKKFGTTTTLTQDADVLDTWFSSWLWPIEVFKGISNPGNDDIKYFYPTSTLITGQDIIFFWVARMIMAGYMFEGVEPFKDVYFTGIVRDSQGRKMSKNLGNSPDLLELIDKFGADAVRFGIMFSSPAGNDLLFDEQGLEQGKLFNNKMWNALKLVGMWHEKQDNSATKNTLAVNWFANKLALVSNDIEKLYGEFKISEILKRLYSLVWDDFCSWYLEWIKPGMNESIHPDDYESTLGFFETLMGLLHPFIPFVTEEVYQHLRNNRTQGDDLCIKQMPTTYPVNDAILQQGILLQQTISSIRDVRNKNNTKPKDGIVVHITNTHKNIFEPLQAIIQKQVNATEVLYTEAQPTETVAAVVNTYALYVALPKSENNAEQKEKLQKDLVYQEWFLASVMKKLDNEKFVANAKPEVIAIEQKKKADAEEKIMLLKASLEKY
jgi:valyl-tRNA synthetase